MKCPDNHENPEEAHFCQSAGPASSRPKSRHWNRSQPQLAEQTEGRRDD